MLILERRLLVFPPKDFLDALRCFAAEQDTPLPDIVPSGMSFDPSMDPAVTIRFPPIDGGDFRKIIFAHADVITALTSYCNNQNVPLPSNTSMRLTKYNENAALMMETNNPGLHVMVIDDHKMMRNLIKKLLVKVAPSRITEACDGQDALEILKKPDIVPDIIICDLRMETLSGVEFVRTLRNDKSNLNCCTPVLILTAEQSRETHDAVRKVGATKVLTKPISAADLNKEINLVCGYSSAT
ncbi:MAG: response regulator [Alphaproteobacteria bacterium]|nr:response regulator [Alphaproteobacteria bacterium]